MNRAPSMTCSAVSSESARTVIVTVAISMGFLRKSHRNSVPPSSISAIGSSTGWPDLSRRAVSPNHRELGLFANASVFSQKF